MVWDSAKWNFLDTLFGFILGVGSIIIKPWIEKNIIYRFIDPIEVYPKNRKIMKVSHLLLDIKNREGYPLSEKFVLINRCSETIIINNVDFLLEDTIIHHGDVTWVYGISDDESKLDDYIHLQKSWFRKNIQKANKKMVSTSGGNTHNLLPIVLEPNKPIKLYSKFYPVVHTKTTPSKIRVSLSLILNASKKYHKKNKKIKLGIFEWKKMMYRVNRLVQ